jgi:hypothetical protein
MIDVVTAGRLLDFGRRIGAGPRADAQLHGAVAIHNLLATEGVAYLADEVGMGKTYVALGALALFRHLQPRFRVLVIAPRENIQKKWMKELRNFVTHNVRFPDLRVKSIDDRPARSLVACDNLLDLVQEATLDPNRDFFVRLTSFSLSMPWRDDAERQEAKRLRDGLRKHLPWMRDEVFDLRAKHTFKDNFARAVCCSLPRFDLVIVDESHNLKHGFGEDVASRNRVLGLAMGHQDGAGNEPLFPGYGLRADRVLFLSATPIEESYRQLWNQLDVFGKADPYADLAAEDVSEANKKAVAARFLIRRVTEMRVGGADLTKNQYRREWRRGGVVKHDDPIRVTDPRQRLVVALIQKKVGELLGEERFKSTFQMGMLASFESFLETAKLKVDDENGNFDDGEQTTDIAEKKGIDVADINRLARSYRERFASEMPHPKMDALVDSLAGTWRTGRKALVFVRRVASVTELGRKLDERYDAWLIDRLRRELPAEVHRRFEQVVDRYRKEKTRIEAKAQRFRDRLAVRRRGRTDGDTGGYETFFAWFFRGEGPQGVVSGATIQQRLGALSGTYGTFFKDNHVATVLGCEPGTVRRTLATALGMSEEDVGASLHKGSRVFLSRAKKWPRGKRFEAVQAAAVQLLVEHPACPSAVRDGARIVWEAWYRDGALPAKDQASEAPPIEHFLEERTFFTSLRQRPELRAAIWPASPSPEPIQAFREQELRSHLLAAASRLGHSLIDLYALAIGRLGSLKKGVQEDGEDEGSAGSLAGDYLDRLEHQMRTPLEQRDFGAFDELSEIATHFELILDVNEPMLREAALREGPLLVARLLREQQPVAGMSGQVNQTLVRQFRMPGYPFVLVTTDVLQEGEDLHTFCSAVHHYGIAWTPSSMEQRTGRIDRVRSESDRRLSMISDRQPSGDEKLQVFFPHLEDTVEVLQVQRVLERMNVFLQLMHEGLTIPRNETRTVNTEHEFAKRRRDVPQLEGRLKTAFPIEQRHLNGLPTPLAADPTLAIALEDRFSRFVQTDLDGLVIEWAEGDSKGRLTGTLHLVPRKQPFTLLLRSLGSHPMVRCVSPVGCVTPGDNTEAVTEINRRLRAKIGAIETDEQRSYDLTVEGEVLLDASGESDASRVAALIRRVTRQADRLEHEHLDRDEGLETFQADLSKEAVHGE